MTEETMKKELNVTEVLDRVKALDNYDKRELFAGRGYKLYYVTDGDFGCLPEAVMHQCIRIFLNQHCVDGSLELPEWIASLPQKTMYAMTRRYLEYMIGNDSYYCDREFKEDTVLRLLRCIPRNIDINVKSLMEDLNELVQVRIMSTRDSWSEIYRINNFSHIAQRLSFLFCNKNVITNISESAVFAAILNIFGNL